jgi:hypothetical protein
MNKCINCLIQKVAEGSNFCSEQCLAEYMIKEIIFQLKDAKKVKDANTR